jgi:diphosphomevalonate decarboxylase
VLISKEKLKLAQLKIVSDNTFPTAAGCASSASSMSCLVKIFSHVFSYKEKFEGDLTTIARKLSGSACRSMFSGAVEWVKSNNENQSIAVQLHDDKYLSDLKLLLIIVNDKRKDTSSTDGMKLTKETSNFLKVVNP